MASGLLYDHQILLPSMLVLLPTFKLGCKYLLPAKKLISNTAVIPPFQWKETVYVNSWLAWAWLAKAKGHSCHTKKSTLAKTFTEKTTKKAKHTCHYDTKKRSVKITMYLGLDIINKLKFTTMFDGCAILNVLNYLTKNFESWWG